MNDRLITAAGALAALAFLYTLFFGGGGEVPVTRPLSTEGGRNGYLALADWLEGEGVAVVSWRERFDALLADEAPTAGSLAGPPSGLPAADQAALAPTGNVLFTTMPHSYGLRQSEIQALRAWIRRGNTLLVAAALNDSPEWLAVTDNAVFLTQLAAVTGMPVRELGDPADDEGSEGDEPGAGDRSGGLPAFFVEAGEAIVLAPVGHPLMAGVDSLAGYSDSESTKWVPAAGATFGGRPYFRLAVDTAADSDAGWQIPAGDGHVLLLASGSLFANHLIADADSGQFIANLLAHHLGPGGAFVFDDIHHGLTTLYDPAAFFDDSRVHATIGFLIAAWFVYLLGATNRVAPVRPERGEPRQADLLAAVGGFMARRLGRRQTGLVLFENWFREIRRRRGLADAAGAPWEALAATPTLSRQLLSRLRADYDRLRQGDPVDLVALHNLIRKARKAIG